MINLFANTSIAVKFIKFCIVGGSGLFIDFGLTYLCKERWNLNKYLANSIGFVVAASSNYTFNRIWTFMSHNKAIAREYASFFIISVIGLILNNSIVWLVHSKFKVNFYISKAAAVAMVIFWNFTMNYLFTF